MRIKIDENLPLPIAQVLRSVGHDVHSVYDENLAGASDSTVWTEAQREQRFFVTQDIDFSDTRMFSAGSHFGILLIRLHTPSRIALINRLSSVFELENVESWARCFMVVTDRKVRVVRPPTQTD